MTAEELQTARAARAAALRPSEFTAATLASTLGELDFPTLPELATALGGEAEPVARWLETEISALRAIELAFWPDEWRYCGAGLLGYVYVCIGDRDPLEDYKTQASQRHLSWLASEAYEQLLAADAPLAAADLRARMGAGRITILALERSLLELARQLKILRVGRADGAPLWRPLVRALPEIPSWVNRVQQNEAAAALLTHRLGALVCESEENLAAFFSPLLSRARIRAALIGLEAGREVLPESLDGRPAWCLRQPQAQP